MKYKFIFTLYISALFCSSIAKAGVPDSILKEVESASGKSKKAELYFNLAQYYSTIDLSKSIEYADQAIKFGKNESSFKELCRYYLFLSYVSEMGGKFEEALEAGRTAHLFSIKLEHKEYEYYAVKNIANAFRRLAKFDSTFSYMMKGLQIAEEIGNDTLVANSYNSLGNYYATRYDFDKAEQQHIKSLEIREKLKDTLAMAYSYNNLGIMYREKGDFDKSLGYYHKAREVYVAINDSSEIAFIYNDIGSAHSKAGNTDSGEYYLKKSIDIRERMKEYNELAYTYNYLGENYERKGNLRMAEAYIKKALNFAIEIKNNKQHYEALESLSDFFARNKMYDSAYKYLQLYRFFRDSIRRLDDEKTVAELNTKYETQKKEKTIQEQRFELTKKNYLLLGVAI
ncbi:MAG: tetratricopeptide repeat protein, partial [Chitinophagaceae bacterium]|nr:tetratricopeptide repeat protein [Chitinophagaceae bacterium]